MSLSRESKEVLWSIFKAERNVRGEYRWQTFLQRGGVIFNFEAPARWGGGTLVYHKIHARVLTNSAQDYISTRFWRKYGWDAATFRGVDD
ncbi:hypothetical protein BV20DRAFT_1058408 [Pilatotrama ljubarskyi]|nr:hypothetical protein BV20DRAFT_1058408 [Pilatotrama ljubarskyi]